MVAGYIIRKLCFASGGLGANQTYQHCGVRGLGSGGNLNFMVEVARSLNYMGHGGDLLWTGTMSAHGNWNHKKFSVEMLVVRVEHQDISVLIRVLTVWPMRLLF